MNPQTMLELARDERGNSLVEFALSASVLLMTIFGIFECSLLLYSDHYVAAAAKAGARYAMVRGSSWSGACAPPSTYDCNATSGNVTSYVSNLLTPGMDASNLTVTTAWPGTDATGAVCDVYNGPNSPGCLVTVWVVYNFNIFLPLFPSSSIPVSSTSAVTISQ